MRWVYCELLGNCQTLDCDVVEVFIPKIEHLFAIFVRIHPSREVLE